MIMTTLDIESAKKDFHILAQSCIRDKSVFKLSTKEGNIVMLSEEQYSNIAESLYLASRGVYDSVLETNKKLTSEFDKNPPWN